MNRALLRVALIVVSFAFASISNSAEPKSHNTGNKPVAKSQTKSVDPKGQIAFLDELSVGLKECRQTYEEDVALAQSKVELAIAQAQFDSPSGVSLTSLQRDDIRDRVLNEMRKNGFDYQQCIQRYKGELSAKGKQFLDGFRTDEDRTKAKEALAQWMTAIDSVPQRTFESEEGRFATLANGLRLTLTLS